MSNSAKQIQGVAGYEIPAPDIDNLTPLFSDTDMSWTTFPGMNEALMSDTFNFSYFNHGNYKTRRDIGGSKFIYGDWKPDGTKFFSLHLLGGKDDARITSSQLLSNSESCVWLFIEWSTSTAWDYKNLTYENTIYSNDLHIPSGLGPSYNSTFSGFIQMFMTNDGMAAVFLFTTSIVVIKLNTAWDFTAGSTQYKMDFGANYCRNAYFLNYSFFGLAINSTDTEYTLMTDTGFFKVPVKTDGTYLPDWGPTRTNSTNTSVVTGNIDVQPSVAMFAYEYADDTFSARIYDDEGQNSLYVMNSTDATLHQIPLEVTGSVAEQGRYNVTYHSSLLYSTSTWGLGEVLAGTTNDLGYDISHDGTRVICSGYTTTTGAAFKTATLATAWDINSTWSNVQTYSMSYLGMTNSSNTTGPILASTGFRVKWGKNGQRLYISEYYNDGMWQLNISPGSEYTISSPTLSAGYAQGPYLTGVHNSYFDMYWKPDGTKLWTTDFTNYVVEWDVPTPWEISSIGSYTRKYSIFSTQLARGPREFDGYFTMLPDLHLDNRNDATRGWTIRGFSFYDSGNKAILHLWPEEIIDYTSASYFVELKMTTPYDLRTASLTHVGDTKTGGITEQTGNKFFRSYSTGSGTGITQNFEDYRPMFAPYSHSATRTDSSTEYAVPSRGIKWLDNGNKLILSINNSAGGFNSVNEALNNIPAYLAPWSGGYLPFSSSTYYQQSQQKNHWAYDIIYTVSTAYDISTINFNSQPQIASVRTGMSHFNEFTNNSGYRGCYISPDGTKKFSFISIGIVTGAPWGMSVGIPAMFYDTLTTAFDLTQSSYLNDQFSFRSRVYNAGLPNHFYAGGLNGQRLSSAGKLENSTSIGGFTTLAYDEENDTLYRYELPMGEISSSAPVTSNVRVYSVSGDDVSAFGEYSSYLTYDLAIPNTYRTAFFGVSRDGKHIFKHDNNVTTDSYTYHLQKVQTDNDRYRFQNALDLIYSIDIDNFATVAGAQPYQTNYAPFASNTGVNIEAGGKYTYLKGMLKLEHPDGDYDGTPELYEEVSPNVAITNNFPYTEVGGTNLWSSFDRLPVAGIHSWFGTTFADGGMRMYIAGNDRIYQFDVETAYEAETLIPTSKKEYSHYAMNGIKQLVLSPSQDKLWAICTSMYMQDTMIFGFGIS